MKNTVWTARWRAELQCPTGHGWRVRNDPPILKKIKKTLDKSIKMCYNTDTKREVIGES
jgi:hypothetical protein